MKDNMLFITGMQRSGTTLAARLLSSLRELDILAQPFPALFIATKRAFLESRGLGKLRYPLSSLFLDRGYSQEQFDEYLNNLPIFDHRFKSMKKALTAGIYSQEDLSPEQLRKAIARCDRSNRFSQMYRNILTELCDMDQSAIIGSKEIQCEEFIPYFVKSGIRCILVIRDPRDIIVSLNYGHGSAFAGVVKPTLFNIRNWRKSIAYAAAFDSHPMVVSVRYEDMTKDPQKILRSLADWLQIRPEIIPDKVNLLQNREGETWVGNSSFRARSGIDTESVGHWRNILNREAAELIEAAALPELRYAGYTTSLTLNESIGLLHKFEEPYTDTRRDLSYYADSKARRKEEVERLRRLIQPVPDSVVERWFIFRAAYYRLKQSL